MDIKADANSAKCNRKPVPEVFESLKEWQKEEDLAWINIAGCDPIINFLMDNYSLARGWVLYPIIFASNLFYVGCAYREGVFINSGLNPDMLHDLGFWGIFFVSMPLFSWISQFFYSKFPVLVYTLFNTGIVKATVEDFNTFVGKWNKRFSSKWFMAVVFVPTTAIFITGLFVFQFGMKGSWHRVTPDAMPTLANLATIPAAFYVTYLFVQATLRIIMCCIMFNRYFYNFDVKVQILHPDGCGGLWPVGKFAMMMNLIVFFVALLVANGLYSNMFILQPVLPIWHPMNLAMIVALVVGAVFIEFMPIRSARKKMLESRDIFLGLLNDEFEMENKKIMVTLQAQKGVDVEGVDRVKSIYEYYALAKKQPVWPFNMKVVYTFLGGLSPIIAPITKHLLEVYWPA